VQRCRENLHIILAFSPVGAQFRDRCRQFPSIINCCTIDWYTQWPSEALYSVAHRFYHESEGVLGIGEYIDSLCTLSVEIHNSVSVYSEKFYSELRRKNYTTPTSYLDLIKTYTEMLKHQRSIVPTLINRYQQGLTRLAETDVIVGELKQNLTKLRPEIDKKAEETRLLVIEVEAKQVEAAETEKITATEEAEAQKKFDAVSEMRADCQGKLDEAMPIYNKAIKALETLEKKDIVEMKSYTNPPEEIGLVISAVCLLRDRKENWDEGKKLMSNPGDFIAQL
jgi:dynein heavy chain